VLCLLDEPLLLARAVAVNVSGYGSRLGNAPRSASRLAFEELHAIRETGTTGLEPTTSGVTGRYGATGYSRLDPELPAGAGTSSIREPALTGYDRLAPGTACVVGVWSGRCLEWQRSSASFDELTRRQEGSAACLVEEVSDCAVERLWCFDVAHVTGVRQNDELGP
jgi:hypothetical protein